MQRQRLGRSPQLDDLPIRAPRIRYTASFSRFADGRIAEIFPKSQAVLAERNSNARDAAVAASLALQFGCPLQALQRAVLRDASAQASTPLGEAIDRIINDRGAP